MIKVLKEKEKKEIQEEENNDLKKSLFCDICILNKFLFVIYFKSPLVKGLNFLLGLLVFNYHDDN